MEEDFDVSRFRIKKLEDATWAGVAFVVAWVLIFFGGLLLVAGA